MMRYSIVATTFNDSAEIIDYLENIMEQELLPSEIVIADGGSKDNTVELIKNYSKTSKVKIKLIYGERLNISEGYNTAIRACVNDVIGITGIGNTYDNQYFKLLIEEMEQKNCDITYSPIRGMVTNDFTREYTNTFLDGEMGQRMMIASNHGALVRNKVFEELGYFYEHFIYAGEDEEFYKLAKKRGYKIVLVEGAKVYWHLPNNNKEFVKQLKGYAIAKLQIQSNWKLLLKMIIRLIPIMCIVMIPVNITLFGGLTICVLFGEIICLVNAKLRGKSIKLFIQGEWMPYFYYITNCKYCSLKYKVDRDN